MFLFYQRILIVTNLYSLEIYKDKNNEVKQYTDKSKVRDFNTAFSIIGKTSRKKMLMKIKMIGTMHFTRLI